MTLTKTSWPKYSFKLRINCHCSYTNRGKRSSLHVLIQKRQISLPTAFFQTYRLRVECHYYMWRGEKLV